MKFSILILINQSHSALASASLDAGVIVLSGAHSSVSFRFEVAGRAAFTVAETGAFDGEVGCTWYCHNARLKGV